jgi:5S rRNA maturation endonuclease (ribonuclease M5)
MSPPIESMDNSDLAELESWVDRLKAKDVPILVEGKKDRAALVSLGIPDSNIISIGGPLYEVVEQIVSKAKKIIILTDLDPEGKKLYSRLKSDLSQFGVEVDDKFREFLFRKTKLRQIEGLCAYLDNINASKPKR